MAKYCVKASLFEVKGGLQKIQRLATPEQRNEFIQELQMLLAQVPELQKHFGDSHHVGPVGPMERPSEPAAPESKPEQQSSSGESESADAPTPVATSNKRASKIKGALFDDAVDAPPVASRTKAVDEDFERFWKVFPRRVNKAKAREAFDRAFKKLRAKLSAEECVKTIVDGAKVYAERANPEMLCHPTTWLNGGRWDDDPDGIWAGERPRGSAGVTLGKMTKEMAQMSYEEQLRQARGY